MTIYSGFSHWKWWFSIVMLVYPFFVVDVYAPFCSNLWPILAIDPYEKRQVFVHQNCPGNSEPPTVRCWYPSRSSYSDGWPRQPMAQASQKEVDGGLVDFGGPETPSFWESLEAVVPLISLDLDLGKALMERKLTVTDCCLGYITLTKFNPHQFLPQKKKHNKTIPLTTRAPSARGPIRWRSPGNRCSSTSEMQVVNLY